jgi:hypothetical protein
MTPAVVKAAALEHDGYETPELNETLYLHFKGFRSISSLSPYVHLKSLWLESNGITEVGAGRRGGKGSPVRLAPGSPGEPQVPGTTAHVPVWGWRQWEGCVAVVGSGAKGQPRGGVGLSVEARRLLPRPRGVAGTPSPFARMRAVVLPPRLPHHG